MGAKPGPKGRGCNSGTDKDECHCQGGFYRGGRINKLRRNGDRHGPAFRVDPLKSGGFIKSKRACSAIGLAQPACGCDFIGNIDQKNDPQPAKSFPKQKALLEHLAKESAHYKNHKRIAKSDSQNMWQGSSIPKIHPRCSDQCIVWPGRERRGDCKTSQSNKCFNGHYRRLNLNAGRVWP